MAPWQDIRAHISVHVLDTHIVENAQKVRKLLLYRHFFDIPFGPIPAPQASRERSKSETARCGERVCLPDAGFPKVWRRTDLGRSRPGRG